MNKYVVSYVSFFENQILSKIIFADSKLDSMKKYLLEEEGSLCELDDITSEEELKELCFNCDLLINSIEI